MAQLIATELNSKEHGVPTLTRVLTGYTGTRYFLVNTRDPALAMTAMGLPIVNETAYSPVLPNVICTQVGPSEIMGGVETSDGTGGWTKIPVAYATPGMDGSIVPPRVGLAYTVWASSVSSRTRFYDTRATGSGNGPFEKPIDGGRGVSVEVGESEVQVVIYPGSIPADVFGRILDLESECKQNSDTVILPPLNGTSFAPLLAPGQLRYRTHEIGKDGDLTRLTHRMVVAKDFWYNSRLEDDKGNALGAVIQNSIYPAAEFAGLW